MTYYGGPFTTGGLSGFNMMFTIVPIMIMVIFCIVIGTLIYQGASVAKDKTKPVVPVAAKVINKRTDVRRRASNNSHYHTYTTYYATFELENGERIEFKIPDPKVGYIVEGDEGTLHFQGNLFVKFERK